MNTPYKSAKNAADKSHVPEPWPMTIVLPFSLYVRQAGGGEFPIREYSASKLAASKEEILNGKEFILAAGVTSMRKPPALMLAKKPLLLVSVNGPNVSDLMIEEISNVIGFPPVLTVDDIMEYVAELIDVWQIKADGLSMSVMIGVYMNKNEVERLVDAFAPMSELLEEFHQMSLDRLKALDGAVIGMYSFAEDSGGTIH